MRGMAHTRASSRYFFFGILARSRAADPSPLKGKTATDFVLAHHFIAPEGSLVFWSLLQWAVLQNHCSCRRHFRKGCRDNILQLLYGIYMANGRRDR